MNDSRLGDWLRDLPRATASPAFTRNVLHAVAREDDRAPLPRPFLWRLAAAFAMAVCLLALAQVTVIQHRQREHTLELRAEQQKLEAELEAVKKIARESEPMVVLEDDRGTRVIMDLDSAIQPASLRNYD
jgi:hypothetical protein